MFAALGGRRQHGGEGAAELVEGSVVVEADRRTHDSTSAAAASGTADRK